ncbi:flavin-containing monooxygenase [Streptomyces sp. NPDC056716]|uniref:flavin-containing monooxygenase n=1 Tax=unclassified Streptomyces TaxID=2593676 RepID=UPI0036CF335B
MTGGTAFDAVVVGAGFSGLYALHRLRRLGLSVVCFEAGEGAGGTWFWNRYPGARVDIESMQYSYSFDEGLQQEWTWPEHFSAQPDLEAYANHVADRFGLREHIRFGTRVTGLRFDGEHDRWQVRTERGAAVTARYVVAATGSLDAHNVPALPGLDSFRGTWYHTARWPKEGVDLSGRRVGLIGTGSTGIQIAPVAAERAAHLHVFQRTPAFSVPAVQRALDPAHEREWKAHYAERRAVMRDNPSAVYPTVQRFGSALDHTPRERQEILERAWAARNGLLFLQAFTDTMVNPEANEIVAEFVRGKIRGIVRDPEVAELLCPKTYPVGAKRICMDTGYYETFNRDNVTLVDVRAHPLTGVTPTGLRTAAAEYDLDVIVFATGFDGVTGSFTALNAVGVDGVALREKWAGGPTSFLGMLVAGFPNLFMVHGPGSPGVLAQMITGGEWQVDWITRFIAHMESAGHRRVDTTTQWEERWHAEVSGAARRTLHQRADSWYLGANIPGKPRVFMVYVGGFDRYTRRCAEQVEAGYEGFVFDGAGHG